MDERCYSRKQNDLPPWARTTLCDICRRYMQTFDASGRPYERIEGSVFCTHCDALQLGACDCPATPELLAAWREWAAQRAEDWRRIDEEGRMIREWRFIALANNTPLGLPVGSSGARMTARVIG